MQTRLFFLLVQRQLGQQGRVGCCQLSGEAPCGCSWLASSLQQQAKQILRLLLLLIRFPLSCPLLCLWLLQPLLLRRRQRLRQRLLSIAGLPSRPRCSSCQPRRRLAKASQAQ